MQKTLRPLASLTTLVTCAILALAAADTLRAEDKKADPNGTWTWSRPGRDGGEPRKSTLTLKAEGEKVTGKLKSPGRQGNPVETEIENGKIKGDEISFAVSREFNGNKFTTKYMGKISGDTIKGKMEVPGRDGGDPRSIDWEAKRETEKKS